MPILSDEIGRAFEEIDRVQASNSGLDAAVTPTFIWKGTEYEAISAIETKGNLFGGGGFTADGSLVLTVRFEVFSGDDIPQPEQFVTFDGHRYRIDVTKPSPGGVGMTFVCNDPNRGTGIVEREM